MRNLVIGTAGHIDHGKTSLVKALTGIDTDTLKEEQERGITVNLGFSYLNLDDEHTVGIVDVPGHEKLIKNMLAGVCGIDLILLTVAADDGIMPQTREHMEIIKFLNVKHVIVVITKIDLVSEERIKEVKQLIKEEFDLHKIVEFSIYKSETAKDVKCVIKDNIRKERDTSEEIFRMPIDRVFNVKGQGVVITGSSLSGVVRVSDELEILPTKKKVKVRGIQSFKQPRKEAFKRMRVALNLGGVKKEDIKRGKIIATKDTFSPSKIIDVKIKVSHNLEEPIKNLEEVKFYYLANEIKCRVKFFNRKHINEAETVYGQLLLDEPIYASNKDLGVLRRINPIKTIAGIEIINIFGEYVNRKDESYKETLILFDENDSRSLIVNYVHNHPFVKLGELKQKLNLLHHTNEEVGDLIRENGVIFNDHTCLTNEKLKEFQTNIILLLENYHKQYPHEVGMKRQICQQELQLAEISNKAFNEFLNLCDEVKVINDRVKLARFSIMYNKEEQKTVELIMKYIERFEFKPPKLEDIMKHVKGRNVKSLYFSLIKEEELIKIEQDIVLTKKRYEKLRSQLDQFFKNHDVLDIKDMRELINSSRKYIIAYLEHLDKVGYTRRTEKGRVKK
ncbi:selenocysteine-specific translation elongation factor [Haloplasma contractile]|uniref:Selenocysteine-specific elongation factor n=1 Tax=Haloplasma contractile SSD-17B TaxID=1033810 RepID=U2EDZ2_9MOLU|nr:selenocysteine-specific translation elongation factor [Haloplasma contractile]ERJ13213.1 Selenocysteine-specific translation elongation factor protein [Haloplasma contractile SSD-17B]